MQLAALAPRAATKEAANGGPGGHDAVPNEQVEQRWENPLPCYRRHLDEGLPVADQIA
jgi:hypothetical protein